GRQLWTGPESTCLRKLAELMLRSEVGLVSTLNLFRIHDSGAAEPPPCDPV
ncbi:hypothetical protein COCCADRAFT_113524, partial [Bipolaris zeicola 26-R-13]